MFSAQSLMRISCQQVSFLFILIFLPLSISSSCPTQGISAYILVTITPLCDLTCFVNLLQFYANVMPNNMTITYQFNFGSHATTVTTSFLSPEIEDWMRDNEYINQLHEAALVNNTNEIQYDDPIDPISPIVKNIFNFVVRANQESISIGQKKQVCLITNYVNLNVTTLLNNNTIVNQEILGLFHDLNTTIIDNACDFPVYSVTDDMDVRSLRRIFQKDIPFVFPSIHESLPLYSTKVFMTSYDTKTLLSIFQTTVNGNLCNMASNKLYSSLLIVQYADNNIVNNLTLPWIGSKTMSFASYCINSFINGGDDSSNCTSSMSSVVNSFISSLRIHSNGSFISLIARPLHCVQNQLLSLNGPVNNQTNVRIYTNKTMDSIYESLILPLQKNDFLVEYQDNEVLYENEYYLVNYSTSCSSSIPFVPLISCKPYHRPKYLHIALDDMLWITVCATISATTFGIIIYQHVKRQQKKDMSLIQIECQIPPLKIAEKENAKCARLPWEIKEDRVHIDMNCVLGKGTISNVYLGKLKGKAPIMQWINRVEMKQFQDCPIAIKVPSQFDDPEEDQLWREISSMRRLKHHPHITLLLGWTRKNDIVCSLLELTHMSLVRYITQIRQTVEDDSSSLITSLIPFGILYKILWEISDGMSYMHSRRLIHRDLAARNILLTAGLRAKISGFGFASDPDDPKFNQSLTALRGLQVKWLAPECFNAKFSEKSDVWACGVLLYEIFSLGEQPYADLEKPEEVIQCVRNGRIPAFPKYASKQIYTLMHQCFLQVPKRRPNFNQLKEIFTAEHEDVYGNEAFEGDDGA